MTLTKRLTKGSRLTHAEMDANLDHLGLAESQSFTASGASTSITSQAKHRQRVHVDDFGAVGDGTTNDATAIQNAINTLSGIIEFGPKTYNIGTTAITLKFRQRLIGKGKRNTFILYSGTNTAVVAETGATPSGYSPGDISDGGAGLRDIGIKCSAQNGSAFTNYTSIASTMELHNVLLWNTHASGASGTNVGLTLNGNTDDAGAGSYAGYWNKGRMLEVKGFNVGVRGKNNANDVEIDGLILDCTTSYELESVSGWLLKASVETSVSNAIGVHLAKTAGKTSSQIVINCQRFEMTVGTPEAIKFGAGTSANITIFAPYYLLNGSPNPLSGTVPSTVLSIREGYLEARGGIRVDGDIYHSHNDTDSVSIGGGNGLSTNNGAILSLYGDGNAAAGIFEASVGSTRTFRVLVGGSTMFQITNGVITCVGDLRPSTAAGAAQTGALHMGSGAPSNGDGSDGDFYMRTDGTVAGNTIIYHKQGGSWVAAVTA
jgi:hypothetical protein